MARVIIDAGHGGQEPGAIYENRKEKDDTLRLALAVGEILQQNGVDVVFTRTEDVYQTPFEKAQAANRADGDFLISIHRNSSPQPNQYSGAETLVFNKSGQRAELAQNINRQLEQVGYRNLGIQERPGLVILRRSKMPAVLVEAGFINTDADNERFDQKFDETARAIAEGILETLGTNNNHDSNRNGTDMERLGSYMNGTTDDYMEQMETVYEEEEEHGAKGYNCCPCTAEDLYRVQTGAFRNQKNAENLLNKLLSENYPAYILQEDGFYKVQVGAFRRLENAVRMEHTLRRRGYSTYITT